MPVWIVSACLIVRNEETLLPRCLDNIRGAVDEIIVVDTGSEDRSVEIARSFGAKVHEHPWEGNFSKHRNQSLSYACGDWILILDADEEMFSQDAARIKTVVAETQADYLFLQCYDLNRRGTVRGVFNQIRLFRNRMGIHYEGRIHNQLRVAGKGEVTRLRFRHHGYDLSPEKMEEKHRRTTSLLLEKLREEPDNALCRMQLSTSYSLRGEYEKAIEEGMHAILLLQARGDHDPHFATAFFNVAHGHFMLGRPDEAEEFCLAGLRHFDKDLNAYHFLAALYLRKQEWKKCREAALKYLDVRSLFDADPEEMSGIYFSSYGKRHEVLFALASASFMEKDYNEAEAGFRLAFEEEGRLPERAMRISRFYLAHSMMENALSWFETAYALGCRDVAFLKEWANHPLARGGPAHALSRASV
jgi:glycosyltransferase involved in cell wall biosynthesis